MTFTASTHPTTYTGLTHPIFSSYPIGMEEIPFRQLPEKSNFVEQTTLEQPHLVALYLKRLLGLVFLSYFIYKEKVSPRPLFPENVNIVQQTPEMILLILIQS